MRVKLAYVAAHLPGYMAEEFGVFEKSIDGLKALSSSLDFELSAAHTHVVTREEARGVADALEAQNVDFVLLQMATFTMGDVVLEFAKRRFKLGLWSTDEPVKEGPIPLNNFVSMNLNAGILRRYLQAENVSYKWFYGHTGHEWFKPRLAVTVKALHAIKRLEGANVALVGGVAPTFYNLVFDERKLLSRLGTSITSHDLSDLIDRSKSATDAKVDAAITAMTAAANVQISERDMRVSAALYVAMLEFSKEHGYDALAVSDWPVFQSALNIHPGMAFSWLDHHDGVPVSSEGDVLGALSMLLMNEISGDKSMLLDMNDVDEKRDAVLMWHCGGSPLNFADSEGVSWKNHSTLGRKSADPPVGAVAELGFEPQPVTILRLADNAKQLFVVEAEIIDSPHRGYDGSRGWLSQFRQGAQKLSLADLVNTVMVEGIEHHFILGKGHHSDALCECAAWLDIGLIRHHIYQNYMQRPHL